MNPYMNEDVMWQRLKDVQREAENRRLLTPSASGDDEPGPTLGARLRSVLSGVWRASSRPSASSGSRRAARPAP
jgi:hypothetical protein